MSEPKQSSHRFLKTILPIVTLVAGYAAFQWVVSHPTELVKKDVVAHYPTIEVINAHPHTTRLAVKAQGTVRPRSETTLKPEVTGRIVWMSPQLVNGGIFAANEKLLEIDATDYRTALASSKTALARAEVEHDHARRELRRIESLRQRNITSENELDQAKRSFKLAEATLNEASIQQEQAQTNIERTVMYAPFAGRVRREAVDIGQYLGRGENIATLYATDFYEVHLPIGIEQFYYLDIPPGTQGVLNEDQTLPVTITGKIGTREFTWQGKLQRTEGEIDAATRLVYGVVTVANEVVPGKAPLLIGMFVKASIQGREFPNIVTLPRGALRDNQQILVVDKDSRIRFRDIDILRIQGNDVLVRGGLKAGEQVCVSALTVAVDGMRVNTSLVSGD
ncbi:MAG: RND family efflux transporter MFP subunit [Bermanella sp.]|jgi:RND family efflux transporter MFP subunit